MLLYRLTQSYTLSVKIFQIEDYNRVDCKENKQKGQQNNIVKHVVELIHPAVVFFIGTYNRALYYNNDDVTIHKNNSKKDDDDTDDDGDD